ncbi:hypothetical protein IFM89_007029 [Coptis chinensis]|uniref:Transposase n=1 Tax=Coptis chinensis TaxID=261450 RepID=A0A835ILL4_9MAGN|nr:hypothetical protein IFM89_007029 [Coptis chinensis]
MRTENIRPTERISNHRLNDETHQGDSFESGLNPSTKGLTKNSTKRGPAVCNVIPTEKSKRLKVTYNERGQPIHEESKKLVSFLGAQVRLMVDINIDNWKKVSNETKDSLWTVTKQKFVVPESARHITMRELGYLWRSSKSRFSRIIASCANEEERMEKRPKNIKLEWWKTFVRKRLSKEFQKEESSNPSSVSRADVWEKAHTKKNGEPANDAVAAKVEKIQEFRETQVESSSLSLQDDAISQLFGPERRGRVRGYGFGVCPSMLGLIAQNNETVAQLQEVVSVLNEKVASMETLRQDMQHHIIEKREMQEQMKNMQQVMTQLMQSQASGISSFVHANKSPPQPSFEGIECKLFRMDKEDIVAEGTWLTNDPNAICSGVKLGPGACKVWVTNALEPSAKVWKPSNGLRTMEQAVTRSIAWPSDHIIKMVFLINTTTNSRIWKSLHKLRNVKILKEVSCPDSAIEGTCNLCSHIDDMHAETLGGRLSILNESQAAAVRGCILSARVVKLMREAYGLDYRNNASLCSFWGSTLIWQRYVLEL